MSVLGTSDILFSDDGIPWPTWYQQNSSSVDLLLKVLTEDMEILNTPEHKGLDKAEGMSSSDHTSGSDEEVSSPAGDLDPPSEHKGLDNDKAEGMSSSDDTSGSDKEVSSPAGQGTTMDNTSGSDENPHEEMSSPVGYGTDFDPPSSPAYIIEDPTFPPDLECIGMDDKMFLLKLAAFLYDSSCESRREIIKLRNMLEFCNDRKKAFLLRFNINNLISRVICCNIPTCCICKFLHETSSVTPSPNKVPEAGCSKNVDSRKRYCILQYILN